MTEWNERCLETLVLNMKLQQVSGQTEAPIHLMEYGPGRPEPLLAKIVRCDAAAWAALGYDETDRVSLVRHLGSLGCRTEWAIYRAAQHQSPLSLALTKALIGAGCDPAVRDGYGSSWDALVWLAAGGQPADPQVTDLFLSAGCSETLDDSLLQFQPFERADRISLRFKELLQEHAQWKLNRLDRECDSSFCDLNWGQ